MEKQEQEERKHIEALDRKIERLEICNFPGIFTV